MNTKTISIFLLIFCFVFKNADAQAPKITPVSPEAAALAKMVNYPVNLNTGVPSISIPLYQIEAGGMNLPITLSYHAGGFKTNERSTSVGLGWSLSTDIQITRSINGLDDFKADEGYLANTKMKSHNPGGCSGCDYPLWSPNPFAGRNAYDIAAGKQDGMPDKFNYKLLNKSGSFYFQKSSSGTGYSIVTVPYDNLSITYNGGQFIIIDSDGTRYVYGEQGNATNLPTIAARGVEISGASVVTGTCTDCNISAWKVRRIVNATKTDSIKFTYQNKLDQVYRVRQESIEYFNNPSPCGIEKYFYQNGIITANPWIATYQQLLSVYPFYSLSSPKYIEHFSDKPPVFHMPYLTTGNQIVDIPYVSNQNMNVSTSAVAGLSVSKIEFRGGEVVFSGADKLNSITVKDANNNEIRSFNLFQTYTNPFFVDEAKIANGSNFNGTLYLDSIQVKNSTAVYERYRLVYKEKYCFGEHLKGKDAWGYPNASTVERTASTGQIGIPFQQIKQRVVTDANGSCPGVDNVLFNIGNESLDESPDKNPAQRGILKTIIYPTGGYVDFDFESNKYTSDIDNDDVKVVRMGGGLRVKTISYFDGISPTPTSQKYYRYGELEDGVGLLVNSPSRNINGSDFKYNAFSYSQTTAYVTGPPATSGNFDPIPTSCFTRNCVQIKFKENKTTYLPASSIGYTYANGAPIYYTKVTEYNSDLGEQTGKKVSTFYGPYEFDTYRLTNESKIPGTNIDFLKADGLMGELKQVEDYKFEKNRYKLEHRKEFSYTKYSRPEQVKVVYSYFNTIYTVIGGYFESNPMELYNSNYSFSGGTPDNEFNAGQYGIEVAKLLLTSERETWWNDTDSLSQVTAYYYNNNNYIQPSSTIVYDSKGQQIIRYFKYSYDFPGESTYDLMKSKNMISQTIEETVHNGSLNKEISKTRTYYGQINQGAGFIAPIKIERSFGGHAAESLITFDLYDQYANILQTTEKDALIKSYIWGYDYKYPLAEVTGVGYLQSTGGISIPSLQAISSESALRTIFNDLRNALPDAMVKTFTFRPLIGVSSQTSPAGLNNFYEYDSFGRLSVIRDHNSNILKKYNYLMIGTAASYGNTPHYVNSPVMATFSRVCENNNIQTANMIVPGGMFSNTSYASYNYMANATVESMGSYYEFEEHCTINNDDTEYVRVNLASDYVNYKAAPEDVNVDFIQNGSIVASRRFSFNSVTANPIYLPKGTYTISLRQDENFNDSALIYYMVPSGGTVFNVKTGTYLNFLPGITYNLSVSNIF